MPENKIFFVGIVLGEHVQESFYLREPKVQLSETSLVIRKLVKQTSLKSEDKDEVHQQALIVVWQKQDIYLLHPAPQAWLRVVIRNLVYLTGRKNSAYGNKLKAYYLEEKNIPLHESAETSRQIDPRIWTIPQPCIRKRIAELYYLQETPLNEICRLVLLSQNTVLSHLKRFRDTARVVLSQG